MTNSEPPSILTEADGLVSGARREAYGHPFDNFTAIAKMFTVLLEPAFKRGSVTAEEAAMCMLAVKLCREINAPKRDNRVDMAGYAKVLDLVVSERAARSTPPAVLECTARVCISPSDPLPRDCALPEDHVLPHATVDKRGVPYEWT